MMRFVNTIINVVVFCVLFLLSVKLAGPPPLTRQQTYHLAEAARVVGLRADDAYALLSATVHALIALTVLIVIRWCVKSHFKQRR